MKCIISLLTGVLVLFSARMAVSQDTRILTFDEVIQLAEEKSPDALMAKHRFRSSYWQYRTFLAQYRPSLILTGTTPDFSNTYDKVWNSSSNGYEYKTSNTLSNLAALSLSQNIGLTGGTISVLSDLTLFNDLENDNRNYISTPLSIGLTQPLFRYNSLKWQKRTEPMMYEAARKTYLANREAMHGQAVRNFFSLALAQINKQIAEMNYSNADTLWRIAKGRYELGTIAEDELLQMQLLWLNAETIQKEADMNLIDREIRLKSFLGLSENYRIQLVLPTDIPDLHVDAREVFDLAMQNNPEIINQQLAIMEAQSNLAQAKAEKGFNANLVAFYGLRDQDPQFDMAYSEPNKQQRVRIGFTMPILDWGLGRGKYKMAQSSLELTQVQTEQAIADFQQNLFLDVEQFNLQAFQVATAAKSDTVAMKMYVVTKQRFLIGKISVLELNNADTRKDQNRRAYVQALQNYWTYFYNIRGLTLFDFINRKPLEIDYEGLVRQGK